MAKSKANELAVFSSDAQIQAQVAVIVADYEAELAAVLTPGEVYDLSTMTARIKGMEGQAAYSLMEIGRMFRAIQIAEGPRFAQTIEDMGRTSGYAYKMISLHAKLGIGGRDKLLALGISKAIELITLEGSELDAIAEGSAVNGLTLDDVDKMSVREVRAAFRKARTKLAEGKETLDMMMQKNSERMRELEKAADLGPKYSELPKELLADVARECAAVCAAVSTIKARVQQFVDMDVDDIDVPDETRNTLKLMVKNAEKAASELIGLVG